MSIWLLDQRSVRIHHLRRGPFLVLSMTEACATQRANVYCALVSAVIDPHTREGVKIIDCSQLRTYVAPLDSTGNMGLSHTLAFTGNREPKRGSRAVIQCSP